MPKMKTHRGAAKRFKVTKSGKVKYNKQGRSHILTKKRRKRKRKMRKSAYLNSTDGKRIKTILGRH